jgi:thioredoxin reductase (NADPH)
MPYAPILSLGEHVQKLDRTGSPRLRIVTDRAEHWTKALIITAGLGMYTPRRLKGAEAFEGRGLYYTVTRTEEFRGQEVLIVGGGDSAVDWALHLEPVAAAITLIHRRQQFRAHEASVRRLLNSSVKVKVPYRPKEVHGEGRIQKAVIVNTDTKEEETIRVDAILACLGFSSELGPMADWGLELEGKDSIRVNTRMETNLPGVYAAGDVADYPGKLKLIVTGLGEAATAVNNAAHYIDPTMKLFPGYSTTIMKRRERAQERTSSPA